ncbi:20684_t:CDS:2, partial [Gigaspora rosea]
LSAKTDHAKNLVRGFKRASSIISLASELAGEIADEPPGAANKPLGAAVTKNHCHKHE